MYWLVLKRSMLVKKEIMVVNSSGRKLYKKDRDEIIHEIFKNEWVEPLNSNIEIS